MWCLAHQRRSHPLASLAQLFSSDTEAYCTFRPYILSGPAPLPLSPGRRLYQALPLPPTLIRPSSSLYPLPSKHISESPSTIRKPPLVVSDRLHLLPRLV